MTIKKETCSIGLPSIVEHFHDTISMAPAQPAECWNRNWNYPLPSSKAARSAATSKSDQKSPKIDFLIFFWDPLEPQPHDPDIKALLRLAVLYNIPTASNRATADFLISSPLMTSEYEHPTPDLDRYHQTHRTIG
jgi:hypothetical protein